MVNIIVAISAVLTAIFMGLTLYQAKHFKSSEDESRRSFIAPSINPGHLRCNSKIKEIIKYPYCLLISLENYGINPTKKIKATITFHNYDSNNNKPKQLFKELSYTVFNPVPNKSKCLIKFSDNEIMKSFNIKDLEGLIKANCLSINIEYFDRILRKKYKDIFYWSIIDGNFVDVNFDIIKD